MAMVLIATWQIDYHPFLLKKYVIYLLDFLACCHAQLRIRMYQLFSSFTGFPLMVLRKLSCLFQPNPWPTFLVKDYIEILIQLICSILNFSLSEGVVIDKFKNDVVTLLFKKPSLDAE